VDEDKMPLWFYLPLHPDARLTAADREVLQRWVDERLAALDAGS
jgi:hypothetical protein